MTNDAPVIAVGESVSVNAWKDDNEPAPSSWSISGPASISGAGASASVTGTDASQSENDVTVTSVCDACGKSDNEYLTVVGVTEIEAEPEVVCVDGEVSYVVITQPEGFEFMVDWEPADTSVPGVHEVVATCGTSSATTTVTVVEVEIAGSPKVAYDGLSTETYYEVEITPEGLEPSSHEWYASWDTPAYNDPQVTFTLPTDSITRIQNAWWYATTTTPCVSDIAIYDIYCKVTIDGFVCSNTVPAFFYVDVYDPGGRTEPPSHTLAVNYDFIKTNGLYMVIGVAEPWNRIDAVITNYYTTSSQFYAKVQEHEQQHKDDFDNGFDGNIFIQAQEYEQLVIGLTNATIEGLTTMLQQKIVEYVEAEIEEMNQLLPILEDRAYEVSDAIPPFFVYHRCE